MRGYWTARCCGVLPSRCSGLCIDDEPQTSHVARRTACLALFRSSCGTGWPCLSAWEARNKRLAASHGGHSVCLRGRPAKDRHDAQGRIGRTITMAKVGIVLSCAVHTTPSRPLHSGHGVNQQLNTVHLPATKIVASPPSPSPSPTPTLPASTTLWGQGRHKPFAIFALLGNCRQLASARLPFAASAPRPGNSLPQKATHHPAKLGVSTHVL
jgi:hypothetical protein